MSPITSAGIAAAGMTALLILSSTAAPAMPVNGGLTALSAQNSALQQARFYRRHYYVRRYYRRYYRYGYYGYPRYYGYSGYPSYYYGYGPSFGFSIGFGQPFGWW